LFVPSLTPYGSGPGWIPTLDALDRWAAGKPARDLFRINPLALAAALDLDPLVTVDAFLAGVLEGWFDLRWDFHCPHCNGVAAHAAHLGTARSENSCPNCRVDFRNVLDDNIEVTFSAAPKLAPFAEGEPEALLVAYHAALGTGNPETTRRLTGLDVVHRPLFQDRFTDEILTGDQSVDVRHVVFLFTDIKGSTALYEKLGDAQAYGLVRDHFKVLFDAVRAQGGLVVKTIGDAVMASFRRPEQALAAALAVHDTIDALKVPGTDESVVVKMGLHAGPAIAVTLNDRYDYFGQTVNKAARIQGLAHDQEIYFSEAVFQDPVCRRTLAARKAAVRRWKTQLKGIAGDQTVYSVR
jgi:class 3 adenylate cyclase